MTKFNKAIRDKIPEIIQKDGHTCNIQTLSDEKFLVEIEKKLSEEIERVRQDADVRISTLESQGSEIEQERIAASFEIQKRQNRLQYLYEQLAILNLGPVSQLWAYDPRIEIRNIEFQISQRRSDWNGFSFRLRNISGEISRLQITAQQRTNLLTKELKKLSDKIISLYQHKNIAESSPLFFFFNQDKNYKLVNELRYDANILKIDFEKYLKNLNRKVHNDQHVQSQVP